MSRQVCAIVGAGEGLGRAFAAKFASQDFDIALISRSEANSVAAIEAAKTASGTVKAQFFSADATRPETIESALATVARDVGEIDVLIYNVRGEFTACAPLDMSYAALEDNHRVEVVGAFAAAKSVLPSMIKRARGSVFFSSATAAFRGSSTHPLYAIGKFGLRALSQSLAKAYAKDGVHIVHFRLDCDLDVPIMRDLYGDRYDPEKLASPDDVAQAYWLTHLQPAGAWSNEVEIRPSKEAWTY
ncbi:MAG: SDR family NAD(P)-dependent oxidoreductase [Gammaproteobacteria bacterium]|nr:SDR family NAD(P)-dependent oxidoreductase [Gammaproteobacteria bacterium]